MFFNHFPLWTTVRITTFTAIYMYIPIFIIIILSAFKFVSFDYLLHIYGNAWVLMINDQIILSCMKHPTVHFAYSYLVIIIIAYIKLYRSLLH